MTWYQKSQTSSDIKALIELTESQIYKYALAHVIQATHLDVVKYATSINTLEALLSEYIEKYAKNGKTYNELIREKENELQAKYRNYRTEEKETYTQELMSFKLSLLFEILKMKMPQEIELEISDYKEEEIEKNENI